MIRLAVSFVLANGVFGSMFLAGAGLYALPGASWIAFSLGALLVLFSPLTALVAGLLCFAYYDAVIHEGNYG